MAYVDRSEFTASQDSLRETLEAGFRRLEGRFDSLDSRTRDMEQKIAILDEARANTKGWLTPIISSLSGAIAAFALKYLWR